MNEVDFTKKHLKEHRIKGDEIQVKECPFCYGGQHKDTYSFGINVKKHTFGCMRGKCGQKGTFKELTDFYGEEADYYKEWLRLNGKDALKEETYIQPKMPTTDITPTIIKYFEGRGIMAETLRKCKVKSMTKKNEDYIVFQFFEDDRLVMNKIRDISPVPRFSDGKKLSKEWKETGGKHILWNMQNVDPKKPVIITEGMIDALSVIEAGKSNTVSIPSGSVDMTWVKNCYDWIKEVDEWILYIDNDEAGDKLKRELISKFGSHKVRTVIHELKDANDELKTFGTEYLVSVIERASRPTIQGLNCISDIETEDTSKMERIKTGIDILDTKMGGYIFPELNVWSGKRGQGKSTIVGQTLLACLTEGYNVFVYTGELPQKLFKNWLYCQAVGEKHLVSTYVEDFKMTFYNPKKSVQRVVDRWAKGRLWIYDDMNTNKEVDILHYMDVAFKQYNCRVFLLDNLMTIKYSQGKDGYYRSQSDFVDKLRLFVIKNNVVVNLVVHPNKSSDATSGDMNNQVGGSGDITNSAFNVLFVRKEKSEQGGYKNVISIVKNRYIPIPNVEFTYNFSTKSKRIFVEHEGEHRFGWEEADFSEVQEMFPWDN